MSIQRNGEEMAGEDAVIQRGDLLWTDFGVIGMRLKTDTQHLGYVLRVGESDAPEGLKRCLAEDGVVPPGGGLPGRER